MVDVERLHIAGWLLVAAVEDSWTVHGHRDIDGLPGVDFGRLLDVQGRGVDARYRHPSRSRVWSPSSRNSRPVVVTG